LEWTGEKNETVESASFRSADFICQRGKNETMKTFRVLTAIVLVLLSLAATIRLGFAKAPVKLVAVLELTNKAGVTDDEAEFLTNKIRNVASQKLPAGRFMIMTRENIETLLPPGTNLKKCTASECEIEVGRKLGAEYIVTGDITSFTTGAASAFAVVVAITGWGGRS